MGVPQVLSPIDKNLLDFSNLANSIRNFRYEQCRWAVLRTQSVDNIAAKFLAEPDLACAVSDPRLAGNELILLRKDRFESQVKVLRDLMSGQAAIHHNLEALMLATSLIDEVLENDKKLASNSGITKAVKLVRKITAQLSSSILVKNPVQSQDTADLTEEEKDLLK